MAIERVHINPHHEGNQMDLQSLTLQALQAVHPNIRLAANELGLSHISDTSLTKLVAPAATVDSSGRYVLGGIPLGTVAWYKTEPVNTYGLGSGGGGGTTVDLSGIQSQISALQEASTKAARIEAVQALQAALEGNTSADATLKQQVDALAASLGNVSSTQLKASVDKLLADVAALQAGGGGGGATSTQMRDLQSQIDNLNSQLNSLGLQLTGKVEKSDFTEQMQNLITKSTFAELQAQVTSLANLRSKSKIVDVSNTETIDTFDGANLITLLNNSGENRKVTKLTGGITGQKIDLRLYANTTIIHDNSFIRCKANTNVVGTNANQFITFVCISGGGLSGSNGVWLEISRNF